MPRPPTKRNRLTLKAAPANSKEKAQRGGEDISKANPSRSSVPDNQDESSASQLTFSAQHVNTLRQLRSQTPLAKTHEHTIESSPMGERGATGSRPPTRSRGYSSTLSIAERKFDMGSKVPGTPAFESSILSNFRRRPRQASILQMMQAEDGSSELDDDDFLGGLSPEDESTPLNLSRGKSLLVRKSVSPSPSQLSLPSSDGSRKRKRSVEECQVPQSPLTVVENTPTESPNHRDWENESRGSSEPCQPLKSLETISQTMAPPLSSSPPSSPVRPASTTKLAQASDSTEEEGTDAFLVMASGAITIPTATLQDRLLPQRRQRHRKCRGAVRIEVQSDTSEDGAPAVDQDDDELSYLHHPKRRTTRSKRKPYSEARRANEHTAGVVANRSSHPKRSVIAKITEQVQENPHVTTRLSQPCEDTNIDKENQPVDTSSPLSSPLDSDAFESVSPPESPPSVNFLSEELRLQAKKFAEIDKWEMEFEEIPGSQGSALE